MANPLLNAGYQDMAYRPGRDMLAGRPGHDNAMVQGKPRPMPIPTGGAAGGGFQDMLWRGHGPANLAGGAGAGATPSPFNADAIAYIQSQYQNLLGRPGHEHGVKTLLPVFDEQGPQAVRQRLLGSEEYQNRQFGPSASPWQTAARQATSNQSMMPGVFSDYANPLFADPASGRQLMAPTNPISQAIFGALNNPESEFIKGILGDLLGTKDDKDKKKAASGGGPKRGSEAHGLAAPDNGLIGTSFLDRIQRGPLA